MKVDVPHVDYETCNRNYSGAIPPSCMPCYGEDGKDACPDGLGVGQNYTVSSAFVIVTLSVGSAPTHGFPLELFSSAYTDPIRNFSGFASLNTNSGNFSYPVGGSWYGSFENALFVINPIVPAMRTLMFTRMDVESSDDCGSDAVTIYNWFGNIPFGKLKRTKCYEILCGSTLPPLFTFESGVGLVTFVTDYRVTLTGFDFQWV
ncbi:Embryonic protein UVS.2 [Folsomia candida]|uniref:Embryonic protein UVS.2 n=1 Tax=Folsomia candida TaxID=158441 RepID=A0A226DB17_FOLCA|nr:Embryonic protein UVS.2 [Folsomia candida]